jgi:uncharacterized protein with PIN domain
LRKEIRRLESNKFIADAMLGSLARKLRILGFDTKYHRSGSDHELEEIAINEGRVMLTSDRILWKKSHDELIPVLLITGKNDRERLIRLLEQASANSITLKQNEARCAVCNGELLKVRKEMLKNKLPDELLEKHRLYFTCKDCGKVYWRGRHWSRLRRLFIILNSKRI